VVPLSGDEALWEEIRGLSRPPTSRPAFPEYLDVALRRRQAMLEKTGLYLAAYPGGRRCDDVVGLELRALFEIGTLLGGAYEELLTRVEDYLRHPPSEAALHEAAYWAIHCQRLERAPAGSPPPGTASIHSQNDLLGAYGDYVERCPRSRYVPRMAAALFEAAATRGDWDEAKRLMECLRQDSPQHLVTARVAAQMRLHEAERQPFGLVFEAADGGHVDTAEWKGQAVLIVVWAGVSEASQACAAEIEAFRRARAECRVVGVNLDGSRQRMDAVCQELGLAWPQFNDEMGWANRFALKWGVREVPRVFVVDWRGRLLGSSGADGWRELAETALEN
jgi:hypothetical protein